MNQRILELAKECIADKPREDWNSFSFVFGEAAIEAFYQAAHQDGQRAMRERAASTARDMPNEKDRCWNVWDAIRNLEIE